MKKILSALVLFSCLWVQTAFAINYFAVGTGNWSGASTVWSTSSGGSPATVTPTSADTCTFDVNTGAHTITVAGTSVTPDNCGSVVMTSPTGTLAMGSTAVLDVAGSWTAASGMTFVPNSSAVINMTATSTGQTWTSAGYLYSNVTFNGVGGGWTLQDAFTPNIAKCIITLTNGTLNTNGQTIGTSSHGCQFVSNNSNTRALTLGSTTWNLITGLGASSWNILTSTGMTLSAGSSTIVDLDTTATNESFNGGGLTYGTYTSTALTTGFKPITGANTFGTLTLSLASGTPTNTTGYSIGTNQTVTGTCTFNGQSVSDRDFIYSATIGTPETISCGTISASYLDMRDIIGAGAGSWNLSAITGGSGDAGGNSGITFNTPKSAYLKAATSSINWSAGPWETTSGGSTPISPTVPLPQDTANIDSNSWTSSGHTLTVNEVRVPTINWTYASAATFAGNSAAWDIYGSVTTPSAMTWSGTNSINLLGRGSQTLSVGSTMTALNTTQESGNYSLLANLNVGSTDGYNINNVGNFSLNGKTLTASELAMQGGTLANAAGTMNLNAGNGVLFLYGSILPQITGTSGGVYTVTAAGGGTTGYAWAK